MEREKEPDENKTRFNGLCHSKNYNMLHFGAYSEEDGNVFILQEITRFDESVIVCEGGIFFLFASKYCNPAIN